MAWLLPGVQVEGVGTAIVAVGVIALLNALLWPLLSYILLPFAVLTLGLLSLLMNGAFILLASALVDGCEVKNLGSAILLALGLTAITTILSSLLTIDDDSVWFRTRRCLPGVRRPGQAHPGTRHAQGDHAQPGPLAGDGGRGGL